MFEYDIEAISRILKIEEFDLNETDLNQIIHVPMHQYRVTNDENPLLLVENLQVCKQRIGINAFKLDRVNNHIFIVDSINQNILTNSKVIKKQKKMISLKI